MAIIIQNVSSNPDPLGVSRYELRINQRVMARFTHKRSEGLAACLRAAADAMDKETAYQLEKFLQEVRKLEED